MSVLRADLLHGRSVLLAGEPLEIGLADAAAPAGDGVAATLRGFGATVTRFEAELDDQGEGGAAWVAERAPFQALVFDGAGAFGPGGPDGLATMLDEAWIATAALANGDLIPGGRPGKVVLLGPAASAGPHAEAARAGLENLARTLSIEWARHGVTTTAVARGERTDEAQLAEIVAFLVSAAGDYFTGCRFDLA